MRDPTITAVENARRLQTDLNIFTMIEDLEGPRESLAGPLSGVPIALKDLIDHAGRVTTCGSAFYRETPARSATAVERLEDSGATIIGRTGLHEFAFGFSSENPHFGPVRNPWDPSTSPGGSSGGSAAAVAAGIVPIAIGTDTGGSVRVPAALCGCFGLKVTYGRIPLDGVFQLVPSIDTMGPLADSVANLELAYRAMSRDERPLPDPGPLRFGIPQPWYEQAPVSEEVAASFAGVLEDLKDMGHEVHPIQLPDVLPDRPLGYAIAAEVVGVHRPFRKQGLPYGEDVAERLDVAESVTPVQIDEGRNWQEMIRARFDDAFSTVDYLVTPTVPAMRKTIGVDTIAGLHHRKVLSWFTAIANHALIPAISVPLAHSGTPPVSLQVMGPSDSEPGLFGIAHALGESGVIRFGVAGVS